MTDQPAGKPGLVADLEIVVKQQLEGPLSHPIHR